VPPVPPPLPATPPVGLTAGLDWAKDYHVLCVVDFLGGAVRDRFSIEHTAVGLTAVVRRLAKLGCAEVAIERPDRPVVDELLEAGLTVVVISPNQVKNLRSRYGSAGIKDDRFDAYVLVDTLRTDRARLRGPSSKIFRPDVDAGLLTARRWPVAFGGPPQPQALLPVQLVELRCHGPERAFQRRDPAILDCPQPGPGHGQFRAEQHDRALRSSVCHRGHQRPAVRRRGEYQRGATYGRLGPVQKRALRPHRAAYADGDLPDDVDLCRWTRSLLEPALTCESAGAP